MEEKMDERIYSLVGLVVGHGNEMCCSTNKTRDSHKLFLFICTIVVVT